MTARRNDRMVLRSHEYTARPKRTGEHDGVTDNMYWTVRCRKKGEEGEWVLGWHPTRREAEDAFRGWTEARRKRTVSPNGRGLLLDVIDRYTEAVDGMTEKRPSTRMNRKYTATILASFIRQRHPGLRAEAFTNETFKDYKAWLETELGLAPQTVLNSVIGARTFLRWAEAAKYLTDPPKAPEVKIPKVRHMALTEEEVMAAVNAAEPPLHLFLGLMWETGMRFAEVAYLRRCDIDLMEDDRYAHIHIREHGSFAPKTSSSERTIPASRKLGEALVELADGGPEAPLFPVDVRHVYHYWASRLRRAQIAAGVREFTFHDLRRAMSDRLRRTGQTVDVYCRYMGHSAITGLRHYSTVMDDDLQEAHRKALANPRRRPTSNKP